MLATSEDPEPEDASEGTSTFGLLLRLCLVFLFVNFCVQIYRKPTELLRFARLGRAKTPRETWREFGDEFNRHATDVITPDFLAALTQVESSGDTLSSPGWTWRWNRNPWRWYGPASSAVGLLQMTDGNYGEARGLCVKDGRVAKEGNWYDPSACQFNGTYSRLIGAHSIEMTSAFLHLYVHKHLGGLARRISLREKQKLAAVMHLCGPNKGPAFIRSGFNENAMGSCGTQPVASYVRLVMKYRAQFSRWAAEADGSASRSASAVERTKAAESQELSRLGSYTRMQPFRR